MKRLSLIAFALAAPLAVMAAPVFSDDFLTDSSLGSEWNMMENTGNASATLTPGFGLVLNMTGGTGKTVEEFAQFSATPITLGAIGDYITLAVSFNSPNATGNNGYLMAGLFNSQGTLATGTVNSTATGGATADDNGYLGDMGLGSAAASTTKFYAKNSAPAGKNELTYYSNTGSYTAIGSSELASYNGELANTTPYILNFTVTKTAGGNLVTADITDATGTVIVSPLASQWSFLDAAGLYSSFDELSFGTYGKGASPLVNITDVSVLTNVPEPATLALTGLGMLGLALVRRMRR